MLCLQTLAHLNEPHKAHPTMGGNQATVESLCSTELRPEKTLVADGVLTAVYNGPSTDHIITSTHTYLSPFEQHSQYA